MNENNRYIGKDFIPPLFIIYNSIIWGEIPPQLKSKQNYDGYYK